MKNIKPANNKQKFENNHQEIRPMRIEKKSAIAEGIDIGNKIISKECYFVNTSLYEVLCKCNEMSIEDNLEPVYLMNGRPFWSEDLSDFILNNNEIRVNWNANGYRIPSFEERFYHIENKENENECVIGNNQCVIDKMDLGAFYFMKASLMKASIMRRLPLIGLLEKEILLMHEHKKEDIRDICDKVSCRIVRGKKNVFRK